MNRELVMATLFNQLQAPPMIFGFTADLATGDVTLANVSDTTGLLEGMPISGDGIEDGAVLATITPTVTLSLPATADVTTSALTQGFQTASRRLAHAIQEVDMPAMYLLDKGELHPERRSSNPYITIIQCELWIFSKAGEDPDPAYSPATALNNLIGAVEQALTPSGSQPGGGLRNPLGLQGVHYCRIEGEVLKDPGYDGRLAGAVIPIQIAASSILDTKIIA
jgi:hypothetical protein